MPKKTNNRCPLQSECERKCAWEGHELDCDYYNCNARNELVIEDQEAIRRAREREREEETYFTELNDADPDEDASADTAEVPADMPIADAGNMVYLPIAKLYPHPDNPRKALGDLTELAESIKTNGVFQNLTVVKGHWATREEYVKIAKAEGVPRDMAEASFEQKAMWEESGYTIIIGHRRRAAAELAGLDALPCVITAMSEREQVSTILMENMQREDLTVYEQAQGFQMMINMGDTPEGIAEKTGFSQKTVKRRLKMAELDASTLEEVSARQIALEDFDKLAKIEDISKRNQVLKSIGTNNFSSEVQLAIREQEIARKLPAAKKLVRTLKASKITRSETYGSKYQSLGGTIELQEWDGISHPVPEGNKKKLFYTLEETWGELSFYTETPKEEKKKRPQAEIDREKRIKEAHEELCRLNELHYELRKAFVNGLKAGKGNCMALLQAAVLTCAASAIYYTGSNREEIVKIFGVEDSNSRERGKQLAAAFDKVDPADYPKLIWYRMCDNKELGFNSTYQGEIPKHRGCERLDVIYTWLVWLGYEMSDDEIALRDGTHEIFLRE